MPLHTLYNEPLYPRAVFLNFLLPQIKKNTIYSTFNLNRHSLSLSRADNALHSDSYIYIYMYISCENPSSKISYTGLLYLYTRPARAIDRLENRYSHNTHTAQHTAWIIGWRHSGGFLRLCIPIYIYTYTHACVLLMVYIHEKVKVPVW